MKKTDKKNNSKKKVESTKFEVDKTVETPKPLFDFYKRNKILTIGVILVMISFLSGYYLKNQVIAATVNGKPVWRAKIVKQLEQYYGANILDYMITQELINQEAKSKGITVSKEEIEEQLKQTEQTMVTSGTTLEKALSESNMTIDDLKQNFRMNLTTEKLLASRISLTDEDIQKYIDQNKDSFPEGTTEEQMKSMASEQLKQERMSTEYQALTTELKEKANIKTLVQY